MRPTLALIFISGIAFANTLFSQVSESHNFKYRETEDETAEWHITFEINAGILSGQIITYGLKPLDFPANKSWAIDKESPPTICEITGRVAPGATKQKRKLEVREVTVGDEPMWIQFTKGQASWTLLAKSDSLIELQVPAKYAMGRNEYKKVLNFREQSAGSSDESQPTTGPAKADNSAKLIGVWETQQKSQDATSVVMTFSADFTYSFEAEGTPFDTGRWKISGDNITLISSDTGPVTFPIKFVSDKALLWSVKKGKGQKLIRIQ
jgi:hypothetical protein